MIPQAADLKLVGIHVSHDDASGSRSLTLPARSLILDAFAICTESAAGSPSMDFGTSADTDGVFSGIGEVDICDMVGDLLEDTVEYQGRGAFMMKENEEDLGMKKTKFNSAAATYLNTQASEGTAGEWDLYILYVVLPEIA
jgi:hypothetical protein